MKQQPWQPQRRQLQQPRHQPSLLPFRTPLILKMTAHMVLAHLPSDQRARASLMVRIVPVLAPASVLVRLQCWRLPAPHRTLPPLVLAILRAPL